MQERAKRLRLPWRDLARASGVHLSTLYRWQADDANPRLRQLNRALAAMEQMLDGREAEMRRYLNEGAP